VTAGKQGNMTKEELKRPYRYERKFLADEMSVHQVRALIKLHPAMFIEPYPPRYVNNIYLDTPMLDCYAENVYGGKDRRKVRIRWYGELFGRIQKPVLEFKIKDGLVGTKESYPFSPFMLDEQFNHACYHDAIQSSQLPQEIKYYLRDLEPSLVNRYFRWYYATIDGRYRVTADTEMCFHNIRRHWNPFQYCVRDHRNIIVELKYDIQHEVHVERISRYFPFSVTRNSKYVQGIEQVYL
jgi:SPX domain protein involved in polyphosphate accumulation